MLSAICGHSWGNNRNIAQPSHKNYEFFCAVPSSIS
jgi:hypothetical protein